MLFRRVSKRHSSEPFNELVEMDLVDGGADATFHRVQDTFPRYSEITLYGRKRKGGSRGESGARIVKKYDMLLSGEESRFIGP